MQAGVLVDAIWGEQPPTGPGAALQTLVTRLRRVLTPAGVLMQADGGYRLAVDAADVDALRFEQLATTGRESLRSGDLIAADAALAEAVALWGENPGAEPAVVAVVAPAVATRLAQVSIEAVVDLAEVELALGRAEAAAARLTGVLAEQTVHERAAALLMDALAAAGRQAEALTVYERVRVSLADALGVDPGSALRERHQRLLRNTGPKAAEVFQPAGLPAPVTSFVGRDDDLARIGTLFSIGRLVTVHGPGGAGKTRLALEAARRHRDEYRDGAWLVDLASVTEPAKVATAVLAGIGLRGGAMFDARKRAPDALAVELGGRECLLVIDNCEHLIEAVARLLTTGSRTAPPRHRTLRAVIAWSWEQLDERERIVAQRISILPGGVTPASAVAVCSGSVVPAAEIPELLATLVDRSLLQLAPESGRYRTLETIREYGVGSLSDTGDLDTARDLAAHHFIELMARQDSRLREPGQRDAMKIISAEYDNTLAALRHLCAVRDSAGALRLALSLTWYWQMSGRQSDGAHWLARALAVPGGEPSPERDCARAVSLLDRADALSGITAGQAAADQAEMRELAGRLLDQVRLPGHYRVFGPVLLFLLGEEAAFGAFQSLADGDDEWLSGLAHMFLAEVAENTGALSRTRAHVDAALARFRHAGDRWGQAAVLPMRARLRRYDDLDGALADLDEARLLASGFGVLSLSDQLYSDLRWIDIHVRRGDTEQAIVMIDAARARALQASSVEMLVLVDAWEAGLRTRLGELDRAAVLLGDAERRLVRDAAFSPATRALAGSARTVLCLAQGDLPGADKALRAAYESALATRELPALAPVTVTAAALAAARGQQHESATLLGTAARLRGAHDHTDPQVRELTGRGRAALGLEEFEAAYATGWELAPATAVTAANPNSGPC
nr:hypothetical protein Ade03nite_79030 [Actinoplanes derwentensis]